MHMGLSRVIIWRNVIYCYLCILLDSLLKIMLETTIDSTENTIAISYFITGVHLEQCIAIAIDRQK